MKELIKQALEVYMPDLIRMADQIYDFAEPGMEEVKSCAIQVEYLKAHGFAVETGIAGIDTAYRAVYEQGDGGPSFGFLAEYDALKDIGHACGHHMQGPAVIGAALALRDTCKEPAYKIVIYGTPAEETIGGKIIMQEKGCFQDIDVALMMHAAPTTCVDVKCMALEDFVVTFHGVESHAAMTPHKGKSAFDAALLSFQGIEFLREHVLEDSRMHYTVLDAGGPANIVPGRAVAEYTLRSYDTDYLEDVIVPRFQDIIKGACLMTATTCDIERSYPFKGKIPCLALNDLIMENARAFDAPQISAPREKTGSTDFGNVMYEVPGSCIRIAFVPEGTAAHSKEYLEAGKTEKAHEAIRVSAQILAGTCADMLEKPELLKEIKEEFARRKDQGAAN
jgi:amidohydrolase